MTDDIGRLADALEEFSKDVERAAWELKGHPPTYDAGSKLSVASLQLRHKLKDIRDDGDGPPVSEPWG